jgi:hypothetical protein
MKRRRLENIRGLKLMGKFRMSYSEERNDLCTRDATRMEEIGNDYRLTSGEDICYV